MATVDEGGGASDVGTFIVGPYSIIEAVDASACRMLGYRADELIGQHGSILVPRDFQPVTAASIDRMRRGEIAARPGRLLSRDGSEVWVYVRSRQLPDGRLALTVALQAPN
jgi:PAS domain S-box-containing protein